LFHLADQIRAHVGGLGINASAKSRKDRDERRSQCYSDEAGDGLFRAHLHHDEPKGTDREQSQTDDQKAGHCASIEGCPERLLPALGSALSRSDVGHHRNAHPDKTRCKRADCSQNEPTGGGPILEEADEQRDHHRDKADRAYLASQISFRAFLNRTGDLPHPLVARGQSEDCPDEHHGEDQAHHCAPKRQGNAGTLQETR
jgi:hypothetical protein